MNILVLDGNQNQAVASVRSLASAGHKVFAGEATAWSKASWSRACCGAFEYPSPQKSVQAFVQAIAAFVRDKPGTLLLPMTELTTLPLSAQRDFLISAGAQLILPDHSELLRAFNKNETKRLAASQGVAVPKTIVVTSPEQAVQAAQEARFPVVLKPQASEELSPDGNLRTAPPPLCQRRGRGCGGLARRSQPVFGGVASEVRRRRGNRILRAHASGRTPRGVCPSPDSRHLSHPLEKRGAGDHCGRPQNSPQFACDSCRPALAWRGNGQVPAQVWLASDVYGSERGASGIRCRWCASAKIYAALRRK